MCENVHRYVALSHRGLASQLASGGSADARFGLIQHRSGVGSVGSSAPSTHALGERQREDGVNVFPNLKWGIGQQPVCVSR